jgi:hypothetical protein
MHFYSGVDTSLTMAHLWPALAVRTSVWPVLPRGDGVIEWDGLLLDGWEPLHASNPTTLPDATIILLIAAKSALLLAFD